MTGSAGDQLKRYPRVSLGHFPSPLEYLPRLTEVLGGPEIWIKRDDCTGLAGGGNKTRKLEFLLADALEKDCRRVVTFGAVQSNHVRQTAAACARLGLDCELILTRRVARQSDEYENSGNRLLDELLGANCHVVPGSEAMAALQAIQDRHPDGLYVIPAGGSNEIGSLGYVAAMLEMQEQLGLSLQEFDGLIHA